MRNTYIVYKLTHVPSGHFYVGSTGNLKRRVKRHFYEMEKKSHCNINILNLIEAIGYFNRKDWSLSIEFSSAIESETRDYEVNAIGKDKDNKLLLNIGLGAIGGDNLTQHSERQSIINKITEATRKTIAKMGEEERKAKWGKLGENNPMFGRTHKEESKINTRNAAVGNSYNRGKKRTKEQREAISKVASARIGAKNPFYGRHHSESTKVKLSQSMRGRKPTNQRPVSCNGLSYCGVTEASREICISPALVIYRIRSDKWDYHYL